MPTLSTDLPKNDSSLTIERWRFMATLGLVLVADWLFFDKRLGLSVAIFMVLLGIAVALTRSDRVSKGRLMRAISILILSVLPLVESFGALSFLFGVIGCTYCAMSVAQTRLDSLDQLMVTIIRYLLAAPFQLLSTLIHFPSQRISIHLNTFSTEKTKGWVIPLALGGFFLVLLAAANPIIEGWITAIDITQSLPNMSVSRLWLWGLILVLVWPFIFFKPPSVTVSTSVDRSTKPLLRPDIVGRSLLVFNIIFAVQTGLDATYLWGGMTLPDGMTYATYAHRGAYPLMITALLAGGFVIAVVKPGGTIESSPAIRTLILLWISQNVLLVVSSIRRLDAYVGFYSLTYLRVAAFIWMVLVCIGLMLILWRIARGYSNRWLVRANIITLIGVLYGCCFINFADVVARYNVEHCLEVSGQGVALDKVYLLNLGPEAIPALNALGTLTHEKYQYSSYQWLRDTLVSSFLFEPSDWRGWSFRKWRLHRYFLKT